MIDFKDNSLYPATSYLHLVFGNQSMGSCLYMPLDGYNTPPRVISYHPIHYHAIKLMIWSKQIRGEQLKWLNG